MNPTNSGDKTDGNDHNLNQTDGSDENNINYNTVDLVIPDNSDDDADDEQEDDTTINSNTSIVTQAMIIDIPDNSDDEAQDDDVDRSICDLMEKRKQLYVT